MTMYSRAATVVIVLALFPPSPSRSAHALPQPPTLDTVLRRCEEYVLEYEPQVSRVVAREDYEQKLWAEGRAGYKTRRLVSDFLFLRLPGRRGSWLGIREVLEVDGVEVGGTRRLGEAAASPTVDMESLARRLAHENARYNLGGFVRTVNVPFVVLSWLHPGFRGQFDFKRSGLEDIDGIQAWRVEFEEGERPTIIRTPDGKEVPSKGAVWLDPETGRVLQTELRNRPGALGATIRVRFAWNEAFGIMVPVSMHERYTERRGTLEAGASYSNFRRFGVSTTIR